MVQIICHKKTLPPDILDSCVWKDDGRIARCGKGESVCQVWEEEEEEDPVDRNAAILTDNICVREGETCE